MCKLNKKSGIKRIDPCIKKLIEWFNEYQEHFIIVASCCGHGNYPMTIVAKFPRESGFDYVEILSDTELFRKKRFYKKDKQGYYYIPEVLGAHNK